MLQVLSCDWQQRHQEPQRGAWWYWHDVQSVQWNCWSALKGMIPVPVRSAVGVAQSVTSPSIPLNAGCRALYRNYVKANNSSYACIWCSCWTGKLVPARTCLFFYFMPARRWWTLINSLVDCSICKYRVWRVIVVCIVLDKSIACDWICGDLVQIQCQPCAWAGLKFICTLTLTKLQNVISW